jgi:hypothetical protein
VLLVLTCAIGATLAEETPTSTDPEPPATARVTYVTGSTVYLDAGSRQGLVEGQRLRLVRGETPVATIEVRELSSRRAACAIVERSVDPEVGDRVQFRPASPAEPELASEQAAIDPEHARSRGAVFNGRIGLRYLLIRDRTGTADDLSQPALDLYVNGMGIAGPAWGFSVDVRTRRTYRDLSDGTRDRQDRTRAYRAVVMRRGISDPWNFAIGRQVSPALAAVSIFDGVSAEYTRPRWSVGLLSGSQPDAEDFGYSTDIREHGVYYQYRGRPVAGRTWQLTTGLIGSYQESEVNREFFYLQGRYTSRRFAAYLAQEVDYNRGWKAEAGEETIAPTSTYINLRYRVASNVSLVGGFDNRRNVRLYRDRITPETEFDDTFRRGVWVGTYATFLRRYSLGLDARTSGGGDFGDADAYTLSFGVNGISRTNVTLRARSSLYTNDRMEGRLHALTAGIALSSRVYLQAVGGLRTEEDLLGIDIDNDVSWYGIDLDIGLGRRWYLVISAERTDGQLEQIDQLYTSLSYRF